ncbi:hypothetical protein GDO78_013685 [Eleutherodactylus coqui]|uniref:Uncharacterized protein n=1 Tax=Eleutherodactylus coqui TaxID=57060 RepID=A0A8J6C496_ELECQ|nr:hypothetical protein GDO78_013685 [Eleutherodactylus coqui]
MLIFLDIPKCGGSSSVPGHQTPVTPICFECVKVSRCRVLSRRCLLFLCRLSPPPAIPVWAEESVDLLFWASPGSQFGSPRTWVDRPDF